MEYSNRMKAKHRDWEEVDDLETRGVVVEAFFGIAVESCRRITCKRWENEKKSRMADKQSRNSNNWKEDHLESY